MTSLAHVHRAMFPDVRWITFTECVIVIVIVHFPHTGYADHHVEEAHMSIEKYTSSKRHIRIIAGDFNAECDERFFSPEVLFQPR